MPKILGGFRVGRPRPRANFALRRRIEKLRRRSSRPGDDSVRRYQRYTAGRNWLRRIGDLWPEINKEYEKEFQEWVQSGCAWCSLVLGREHIIIPHEGLGAHGSCQALQGWKFSFGPGSKPIPLATYATLIHPESDCRPCVEDSEYVNLAQMPPDS